MVRVRTVAADRGRLGHRRGLMCGCGQLARRRGGAGGRRDAGPGHRGRSGHHLPVVRAGGGPGVVRAGLRRCPRVPGAGRPPGRSRRNRRGLPAGRRARPGRARRRPGAAPPNAAGAPRRGAGDRRGGRTVRRGRAAVVPAVAGGRRRGVHRRRGPGRWPEAGGRAGQDRGPARRRGPGRRSAAGRRPRPGRRGAARRRAHRGRRGCRRHRRVDQVLPAGGRPGRPGAGPARPDHAHLARRGRHQPVAGGAARRQRPLPAGLRRRPDRGRRDPRDRLRLRRPDHPGRPGRDP